MTLEIIVFILAILFGIVWYWRESKNNRLYRMANKITHSKALQMKSENKKGFLHEQNLLLRLVWITLFFVIIAAVVAFVTPINIFFIQYFASAVVGTLIGTYIASLFILTKEGTSKENLEKAFDKGKDFVEDLVDGKESEKIEQSEPVAEPEKLEKEPEVEPKKSARDRLRDKGMIK